MKSTWVFVVLSLAALATPTAAHAAGPPAEPAVISVDTVPYPWLLYKIHSGYQPEIPWSDAYADFVDVHAYVPNVTVEDAWSYVSDIAHLEEWTMSVRNVQPFGELGGRPRYIADEHLPPGGNIYFLEEKDASSRTVDWWVGHDPENIWMRYTIRVLDAQDVMGKPGAVVTWVNFGHANFQSDPVLQQGFLMMEIAHGFERDNLSAILQWRASGHDEPVDIAVMTELGLFNVELLDPMTIWGTIAAGVTPTVPWESYYGDFIGSHFHLPDVAPQEAWDYLSSIDNFEDWTVSLRHIREVQDGFRAFEYLSPFGPVRGTATHFESSQTMDVQMRVVRPCGQRAETMNSTFRVLAAEETNGKQGTVVVWLTYHHADLDLSPLFHNYWQYLPVRNQLGASNLAVLLGVTP